MSTLTGMRASDPAEQAKAALVDYVRENWVEECHDIRQDSETPDGKYYFVFSVKHRSYRAQVVCRNEQMESVVVEIKLRIFAEDVWHPVATILDVEAAIEYEHRRVWLPHSPPGRNPEDPQSIEDL